MDILELFRLDDRVAIVTGAARGIGREFALALAEAGADVACVDLLLEGARETAAMVAGRGRRTLAVKADVSKAAQVERMVARTVERLGRIDILVNNAGICINAPAEELTEADWDRVYAVDVKGVFLCSQAAGRVMLEQGKGSIVNVASMSGLVVNHPQAQAGYNSAKAAVIHLTRSLAAEWAARGVRVNAISPGYTATEMTLQNATHEKQWKRDTPTGRLGRPRELCGALVYLASDASSWTTGHNLVVDGGYTLW